jgi:hypothetical protein
MHSPVSTQIKDGRIEAIYRTDSGYTVITDQFSPDLLSHFLEIEAKPKLVPSYLWNKTFVSGRPEDVFYDGKTAVLFPLIDWTKEDFEAVFKPFEMGNKESEDAFYERILERQNLFLAANN